MDKEKVLDKIKKCLALGQSANEHEAAQALKQAQALMEKYEVNAVDIALSEVSEQKADRKMAFKLADWQWGIANMIADIFGCQSYQRGKTMMFYGIGNRAEISAYAFFRRPPQIFENLPSKKARTQNLSCRPILRRLDCECL